MLLAATWYKSRNCSDTTKYRNPDFGFVFANKNMKKALSKVRYNRKIKEHFSNFPNRPNNSKSPNSKNDAFKYCL